jgi:adenylylsulfate kinase-like enzyme
MTGIDSPYEAPSKPDLVIDASASSIDQSVRALCRLIDSPPG